MQVRNAYRVLMKKIVRLLGANGTGEALMDKVYDFEKKLANVNPVAISFLFIINLLIIN